MSSAELERAKKRWVGRDGEECRGDVQFNLYLFLLSSLDASASSPFCSIVARMRSSGVSPAFFCASSTAWSWKDRLGVNVGGAVAATSAAAAEVGSAMAAVRASLLASLRSDGKHTNEKTEQSVHFAQEKKG